MTEKTLLVENPFKLEQNKKKEEVQDIPLEPHERLYAQTNNQKRFGLIRALEEEAEKIAKAREESLARDQQAESQWKKRNKSMKLWDLSEHESKKQAYRINNILKEKRETISEFVQKKRQIFLSNMNITNKKEESNRLQDFIQNEKESLKARQYYFKNDCDLVKKFMSEVKKAAEEAQKDSENQAKKKEQLKDEINKLNSEIEKLDNQITQKDDDFKNLDKYKKFIDEIQNKFLNMLQQMEATKKKKDIKPKIVKPPKEEKVLYLTEFNQADDNQKNDLQQQQQQQEIDQQQNQQKLNKKIYQKINFEPIQLLEIMDHIEEKNLNQIQQTHSLKGELEILEKKLKEKQKEYDIIKKENSEKISELEKQLEQQQKNHTRLLTQSNMNLNQSNNITDGEQIDVDKISQKISQIYKLICDKSDKEQYKPEKDQKDNKDNKDQHADLKETHNQMRYIEKHLEDKLKEIKQLKDLYPDKIEKIEKSIKEQEKAIRTQQEKEKAENQQRELLEKKNQQRDQNLLLRRKGRAIMEKSYLVKQEKQKKVQQEQISNDDEKYLDEDFDMRQDVDKID